MTSQGSGIISLAVTVNCASTPAVANCKPLPVDSDLAASVASARAKGSAARAPIMHRMAAPAANPKPPARIFSLPRPSAGPPAPPVPCSSRVLQRSQWRASCGSVKMDGVLRGELLVVLTKGIQVFVLSWDYLLLAEIFISRLTISNSLRRYGRPGCRNRHATLLCTVEPVQVTLLPPTYQRFASATLPILLLHYHICDTKLT
mmetsp:Transcript_42614/g.83345  ORF Transcript_42614/g.83345 Transcript_42614/m.83345 type:complete len:203 (-) Transcript_42614:4623-5231(-)